MRTKNFVPIKIFQFFYNAIFDIIYPPYCIFCKSHLERGKDLACDTCWELLPYYPVNNNILNEIIEKLKISIYLSDVKALWEFKDNVQVIIHEFKYKHHRWLAVKIADHLADFMRSNNHLTNVEVLIPVPLHKKRKRNRGYNQSSLICKAISKIMDIPVDETSLQRIKNTKSQTKLTMTQRLENVADAFRVINNKAIEGKSVLLIDDVITTGSTINACALQLKLGGACDVFALSAAKA